MKIEDMFQVGEILEWENKSDKIKVLDGDDCKIVSKSLNKNKIILHMERAEDGSEGNVFVVLKEQYEKQFPVSKSLLASKNVVGLTLNQFKNLNIEEL